MREPCRAVHLHGSFSLATADMAFDPGNTKDLERLANAMIHSRDALEVFRQQRNLVIREYVGRHYGDEKRDGAVPINLVELAVNIWTQQLVANAPQVMATTKTPSLKAFSVNLALAVNDLVGEIDLQSTLEEAVHDALFSIGIVKVGLATVGMVEVDGTELDVAEPFAISISLDDWVHDIRAEAWNQSAFEGHRYYPSFEKLETDPQIDQKVLRTLSPDSTKYEQDEFGTDFRASDLSQGDDSHRNEFGDTMALWDVFLPETQRLITFPAHRPEAVLRVLDWQGPVHGPFHKLGFGRVPGNVMPLSPLAAGLDLHFATNVVYRKNVDQAQRQKEVLAFQGSAHGDAERIRTAADGDVIRTDNLSGIKDFKIGGVDTNTFVFYQDAANRFKEMMGNLDAVGGLGPQSDTLGQDRMISASASLRIRAMQGRVFRFTKGIATDLAFYMWSNPLEDRRITKNVGGREIPARFNAAGLQGSLNDYDIDIDPFSMQDRSPSQRLQGILNFYQTVLVPGQQFFAADGGRIDYQVLTKLVAELMHEPEINNLVRFGDPGELATSSGDRPLQSPVTTRNNVRIQGGGNRPGANPQMGGEGKELSLQSAVA